MGKHVMTCNSEKLMQLWMFATFVVCALIGSASVKFARAQHIEPSNINYANQGWTPADRDTFYTTSQGSLMMRYAWFKALRRIDVDEPFGGDQLQRYGYLPNERSKSNPEGLPVGFVITGDAASGDIGMNCAACHTAQIEYEKDGRTHSLRLDGAPAKADFQLFLSELTQAARKTLSESNRFDAFARDVLGKRFSTIRAVRLKAEFGTWVQQFGDLMDASLPATPWGPGRLDAFGMTLNRVAGHDLNIRENLHPADAPVSYPFLWNASRQDRTLWTGGVRGGLSIQALGRNTGEAFGAFARFKPVLAPNQPVAGPPIIRFGENSISFAGLQKLEEQIARLRPPPWPKDIFGFDQALADKGKALFETHCAQCHGGEENSDPAPGANTTPVKAVGTDPKVVRNTLRLVDPGILIGSLVPETGHVATLENPANAHDLLAVAAVGTLAYQAGIEVRMLQPGGVTRALRNDMAKVPPDQKIGLGRIREIGEFINMRLAGMYRPAPITASGAAYASRPLQGIWATAPYLHNGSVPNLWELLKPARERMATFKVGSRMFDQKYVGYVTDQSPYRHGDFVADPANQNGNGNGGHEFGIDLTEDERWALIEYLKGL